jgi:hypothetical protein
MEKDLSFPFSSEFRKNFVTPAGTDKQKPFVHKKPIQLHSKGMTFKNLISCLCFFEKREKEKETTIA